jgi:hypothetical protein
MNAPSPPSPCSPSSFFSLNVWLQIATMYFSCFFVVFFSLSPVCLESCWAGASIYVCSFAQHRTREFISITKRASSLFPSSSNSNHDLCFMGRGEKCVCEEGGEGGKGAWWSAFTCMWVLVCVCTSGPRLIHALHGRSSGVCPSVFHDRNIMKHH